MKPLNTNDNGLCTVCSADKCESIKWRPILMNSKYNIDTEEFTLTDGKIIKRNELPSYNRIVMEGSFYASYNPTPLLVAKYKPDNFEVIDVHCE
jgi:hypothetical protein